MILPPRPPVPHHLSPSRLFLGLDLGLRADHSTLAFIERASLPTGEFDSVNWQLATRLALTLRALHRWPLGTPYLDISDWISETLAELASHAQPGSQVTLALDAAGPGAPIVELLRSARTGTLIEPILITGGHHPGTAADSTLLIPRENLFSCLRMTLERDLLIVPPNLPLRRELNEEVAALGQLNNNRHDDLAIALALAVHSALRHTPSLRRQP